MDAPKDTLQFRIALWAIVLGINLPVPTFFGVIILREMNGGLIGMGFGILLVWAIGLPVCAYGKWAFDALFTGGIFLALTQFIPLVQIAAGVMAGVVLELATGDSLTTVAKHDRIFLEVRGLALTLLTAQPLVGFAFLGGLIFNWLFRDPVVPPVDMEIHADPADEPPATSEVEPIGENPRQTGSP